MGSSFYNCTFLFSFYSEIVIFTWTFFHEKCTANNFLSIFAQFSLVFLGFISDFPFINLSRHRFKDGYTFFLMCSFNREENEPIVARPKLTLNTRISCAEKIVRSWRLFERKEKKILKEKKVNTERESLFLPVALSPTHR